MSKLSLKTPVSGYLSAQQMATNNQAIEDALENTLSLDGTTPNSMLATLDMNEHRIINLDAPLSPTDAARLKDITDAFNAVVTNTTTSYASVVDIRNYIKPSMAISSLGDDPSSFYDVSELVRQAQYDAGLLGVPVDYTQLRGLYFLDPLTFIPVYKGSGMLFPQTSRLQLAYTTSGGLKDSVGGFSGLAFIVNPLSTRRTSMPVFGLQGGSTLLGPVQIAGVGLANALNGLNVSAYPTITGTVPQIHAPIVACDCRTLKPSSITAELHIVGVMQGFYLGDPLISEEPWSTTLSSANVASPDGKQGAASFGRISITGAPCYRLMGFARGTSGGLFLRMQAIPPYWTAISQPNSGGLSNYAGLKYFQQFGTALDMWHRAVGFDIGVQLRGFRTAIKMRAGTGLGPNGQDTGKYNGGKISFGVERVITLLDVDQYSYLHRVDIEYGGHVMDEYNLKGENAPAFWIKSDAAKAGAVDKAVGDAWVASTQYFENDKVANGGNVYSCVQGGTSAASGGPTGTNTTTSVTDGTCKWIYRNGGFKPFGYPPFARVRMSGVLNEISGGLFENTANDGHLFYNMDGSDIALWKQANGHHGEALIWNKSTGPVIRHMNSAIFASANSKLVYDVVDTTRLHVSNNEYFGYTINGTETTQIGGAQAIIYTDCNVYDFAMAQGDDYDDDDT